MPGKWCQVIHPVSN